MGSSPSRLDKAEVDMKALAILSYCEKQRHPLRDYLVLMTIKVWQYLVDYCTTDHVQKITKLTDIQLNDTIQRLMRKGWVAQGGGYLKVTPKGNKEFYSIRGHISYMINEEFNYKEQK